MYKVNISFTRLIHFAAHVKRAVTQHAWKAQLLSTASALMAGSVLAASTIFSVAAEHSAESHAADKPLAAKDTALNHDVSKKIYPSRAVQGVDTPLAPGAVLHKMTLSHHELEPWSFVPKRKDRIEIKNLSNITHALYVTYPDGTVVNLEIQIPGDVVGWTVPEDAKGEFVFRCWIHPVIRAKMLIEN